MTRTTPELAPLSKLPNHTSGRTFGPDGFSVHQTHLHDSSSGESGFETGTFRHRGRDITTRPRKSDENRRGVIGSLEIQLLSKSIWTVGS
ncbi:hypothetical protein AVEN_167845-1 [Araneus ventricosus]|uniref:Uncharacterized protein n=1 Tax=Araneus ventricosus TaxID=182803 RepID=A0A4Y2KTF0_ARAVE|nr:hypothetical protein AVEN_167845-1 [Araneus ventricosus]